MRKLRITIDAIDEFEVHHKVFEGKTPEDAIAKFDDWVNEHFDFEEEKEENRNFFENLI